MFYPIEENHNNSIYKKQWLFYPLSRNNLVDVDLYGEAKQVDVWPQKYPFPIFVP